MALPRRNTPVGAAPDPTETWLDPEFKMAFPSLYSFLFDPKYDDGSTRLTGSISLFTKLGALTVAINDNDRQLVAFMSAPTWDELISLIESAIRNDNADWKGKKPMSSDKKTPF